MQLALLDLLAPSLEGNYMRGTNCLIPFVAEACAADIFMARCGYVIVQALGLQEIVRYMNSAAKSLSDTEETKSGVEKWE